MIANKNELVNENLQEFAKHKRFAEKLQSTLANVYVGLDAIKKRPVMTKKGYNILDCGTSLAFQRYLNEDATTTLHGANFCKHKLCPFCAWRWHLKQSRIISKTFELLGEQNYFHLVLTIPNTPYLTKDFLLGLKQKTNAFMRKIALSKDYFIGFEITIDEQKRYHPHFHIVYIDHREKPMTRKYIQTEWARIANTGTNYAIAKQTKCNSNKISMELTKYILKFDNIEPSVEQMRVIDFATKGIRKFSTSGAIKEAEQEAKLIIDREKFDKLEELAKYDSIIEYYKWFSGSYDLIEQKQKKARNND